MKIINRFLWKKVHRMEKRKGCKEPGGGFEVEGAGQGIIFVAKPRNPGSCLGRDWWWEGQLRL